MRLLSLCLLICSSLYLSGCFKNPDAVYANAVRWLDGNQLDRAEKLLLSVLQMEPKHQNAVYALGVLYLKQNRLQEAQSRFEEALELNQDDAEAMVNLGVIHARQNRLSEAEEMYMRAIAKQPGNSTVILNLARLFARQQKLRDARLLYEKILRSQPGLYAANKELAYILKGENRYQESIEQFTKALRLNRKDYDLYYELGVLNFRKGNLAGASKFLLSAVAIEENPEAYLALGEVYRIGKKPKDAIQSFEKAYSLKSDSYDATFKLAGLYLSVGLQETDLSEQAQEFEKAGIYIKAALSMKADAAEAYKLEGLLRFHQKRWDQALDSFNRARELNRYVREIEYFRGMIARNRGDNPAALEFFLRELMEDPSNYKAALEIGEIYLGMGEHDKGVKLLKNTLGSAGENADLWELLGRFYLIKANKENEQSGLYTALESYDEAINAFRSALRLEKERMSALESLLSAYTSARRYAVAIPFLEQMLDKNPDSLKHYPILAMGYSANQQYDKAQEILNRYLKRKPEDAEIWFQLGKVFADKGAFEDGAKAFDRSIELDSEDGRKRMYLGMLLAELNRFEEALEVLRLAIEKSADDVKTRSRCEELIRQILEVSGIKPETTSPEVAKVASEASRGKSRERMIPGTKRYVKGMLYSVYIQIQNARKTGRWDRETRKKALGLIRARLIRNYRQLVKHKKFEDKMTRRIYFLGIKKLIDQVRTLKPK